MYVYMKYTAVLINVRAIVFKKLLPKSMLVSKKNTERKKIIVKCNLKKSFKNK